MKFILPFCDIQQISPTLVITEVTCGSVIKLKHVATGVRLHSHQVTYGSGSGQQSVTGYPHADDPNSLWLVAGPVDKHCPTGYLQTIINSDYVELFSRMATVFVCNTSTLVKTFTGTISTEIHH